MVRLLVEKYIFDAGGMKDIDGGIVLSSLHDIIGSEDICQEVCGNFPSHLISSYTKVNNSLHADA